MFSIPFIGQSAADSIRRQLQDLSSKIGVSLQPIFTSKKIGEIIKTHEPKPKIINEQCVVYHFKCGLCEMDYVRFTNRHLFQRINEHTNSRSSIGKHMKLQLGVQRPAIAENFTAPKRCRSKQDCFKTQANESVLRDFSFSLAKKGHRVTHITVKKSRMSDLYNSTKNLRELSFAKRGATGTQNSV